MRWAALLPSLLIAACATPSALDQLALIHLENQLRAVRSIRELLALANTTPVAEMDEWLRDVELLDRIMLADSRKPALEPTALPPVPTFEQLRAQLNATAQQLHVAGFDSVVRAYPTLDDEVFAEDFELLYRKSDPQRLMTRLACDAIVGAPAAPPQPESGSFESIAMFRTHKTGSTTLLGAISRALVRRGQIMFKEHVLNTLTPASLAWAYALRNSTAPRYHACPWHVTHRLVETAGLGCIFGMYRQLLPRPLIITVVRDPASHFASWYYAFVFPQTRQPLDDVADLTRFANPQARDFGLAGAASVDWHAVLAPFHVVCVFERLDECLALVTLRLGWSVLDATFIQLRDSLSFDAAARLRCSYHTRVASETEAVGPLDADTRSRIAAVTNHDRALHTAALARFDEAVAATPVPQLVLYMRHVNDALRHMCARHARHALCLWYRLEDHALGACIGDPDTARLLHAVAP